MADRKGMREMTLRAVGLGLVLSMVMGAANVYLGLRVGMTVTASVPAAVVAMVVLRKLLRGGTILESNQVQTAASAGESLAAGVIFTLPALVMVGAWSDFNYLQSSLIALAGGVLGVLFMVPMREVFIARGEGKLAFPEGVACAEVLRAGEAENAAAGGARGIFIGGLVGASAKLLESTFGLLKGSLEVAAIAGGRAFYLGTGAMPALIAVGFIVRLGIAANVFIGGALAWIIAIPLVTDDLSAGVDAVAAAKEIWSTEVRYLGVGAMLVGGILTIWQVRSGLAAALAAIAQAAKGVEAAPETERNLRPTTLLVSGIAALVITAGIYLWFLQGNAPLTVLTTVIMLVASFFFTAVASYIVGLVGNSNSPVSGMTITAVLATGVLLSISGFSGMAGMTATLGVAAVVCCVACTAGDVCNDLKTGALVGATPAKQQTMQLIGVAAAAFILAPVLQVLHLGVEGGIGSEQLPAPQAKLFASLARGFFGQEPIPWNFVGAGAGIGLAIALAGALLERRGSRFRLYVMPTAVGLYLPLSLSSAILLGGGAAWIAQRKAAEPERVYHRGMLFASGLIAGESLLGIGIALLAVLGVPSPNLGGEYVATLLTILALVAIVRWQIRAARG
ncbi:MAG: OPT family oligopeptide transporter [Opitutales bacterium]